MLSRTVLRNVMAVGLLPSQCSLDSSHRNYQHCQEELFIVCLGGGVGVQKEVCAQGLLQAFVFQVFRDIH